MAANRVAAGQPADKVLMVEGHEDQHMIWNLLESHGYLRALMFWT
jgi:hypothetical protein